MLVIRWNKRPNIGLSLAGSLIKEEKAIGLGVIGFDLIGKQKRTQDAFGQVEQGLHQNVALTNTWRRRSSPRSNRILPGLCGTNRPPVMAKNQRSSANNPLRKEGKESRA